MRVIPIATTKNLWDGVPETGFTATPGVTDADELAEIAGRVCYQSFDRPRPATATNEGYLANIIGQGHFSVLEHASISFYVEGVSRSLLTELERHRFLSFSVISQRFVGAEHIRFVVPPAFKAMGHKLDPETTDADIQQKWDEWFRDVVEEYEDAVRGLTEEGFSRKEAREAARAVLPNCTETKFVVTGNIRCWRDVISKRYHVAADAEIRDFSAEVLRHLREYAPNSVGDIPTEPYGGE